MEIKDYSLPAVSFTEFARQHNLVMEIHERPVLGPTRYYAFFSDVEVMCDGFLTGTFGNGSTKEEAMADYRQELAGKRIAVSAFQPGRREIQCPNEWTSD